MMNSRNNPANFSKPEEVIGKGTLTRLLVLVLCLFIISTVASALFLYLDIDRPLDSHYSAVLSIIAGIRESLVIHTIKIFAFSSILVVAGVLIICILYTHRIAGPHQRIKSYAKSVAEGRLDQKIGFRNKDVIHSFAETLNAMTKSYSERVTTLSSEMAQLKEAITEIKTQTGNDIDTKTAREEALDIDNKIRGFLKGMKL